MTPAPTLSTLATPSTDADVGSVVSALTTELAATSEMEPLLARFLVSIVALAGAQAGAVRVLTDDGQSMRLVAQQGLPAQVLSAEQLVARDCGMCGIASSSDVLGWVDDVRSCAQHGTESYFGVQCKSVLAISLPHDGQMLGIYNLFFEADAHLSEQTQTILRLIGQLLGLTLHNARIER